MKQLFVILLLLVFQIDLSAQNCSDRCKKTINNGSEDVKVNPNDVVCLTGTYQGSIEMKGGELYVCANANINQIEISSPGIIHLMNGKTISIGTINANSNPATIENLSDSVILQSGNFNGTFQLTNLGKFYCGAGNFNGRVDISNSGTLVFTNGLSLNNTGSINNSRFLKIIGRLNMNNSGYSILSTCNFEITNGLNLGGQQLRFENSGIFKLNGGLNINSGSIILKDATMMQVDNMTVGGYIEGTGGRSTIECTNPPNLNLQGSVRGNISLCVKSGTFNPNPGTVTSPATVDCNNPLSSNDCRNLGASSTSELFRLKINNATDWTKSTNWEMYINGQWQDAPSGRYPMKGSTVTIDGNKKITISSSVISKSIILGNTTSYGVIESATGSNSVTAIDSIFFSNPNSQIKTASLIILKSLVGSIQISGSSQTQLVVNLANNGNINLKMDNSTSNSSKLSTLIYNLGSGTMQLLDTLKVTQTISPLSGTLNTNNKLVLFSDQNFSACILRGNGNYLTGKVTIQDYIPSIARRYRFLSSPVSDANLKDWQNEVFITGNNSTGTATGNTPGTLNSAGFDATTSNQPGIYYYNEPTSGNLNNGWKAITNESNTLADIPLELGKGYRMFIRGDRSDLGRLDGTNNTQNEVTIDLHGTIHTGDFPFSLTYSTSGGKSNDGWNMIGNPYPAAYDYKTMYKEEPTLLNNLDPTVWIYNAKTNSYVSYNFKSNGGSLVDGIIPPGQSFWVKANAANPSLTWKENYKIKDNGIDYRSINNGSDEIKFTLVKDSINSDQVIIKYLNGASKLKDEYDIEKFWSEIGIGTFGADSIYLDMSCRPIDYFNTDFVPIYFYVDASGTYALDISQNLDRHTLGSSTYLLDDYTQQYINIRTQSTYIFNVDKNIPATENYNRFYLVYLPAVPAATNISYFFGERDKSEILLNWGTDNEPFPITMNVERGESFYSFEKIGSVSSLGNNVEGANYEFIDSTANFNSPLYYRLILSDSIYGSRPSTIIMFDYTGNKTVSVKESKLLIYPNPVHDYATIQLEDATPNQSYTIQLYDISGKQCYNLRTEPLLNNRFNIPTQLLKTGMYYIKISDGNGYFSTSKFIKE